MLHKLVEYADSHEISGDEGFISGSSQKSVRKNSLTN